MAALLAVVPLVVSWHGPPSDRVNSSVRRASAKRTATRAQIASFLTALAGYKQDVGSYPTTAQGLSILWQAGYFPREIPPDPWNNPYVYTYPGNHGAEPDIISYGADGRPGGEGIDADVVSWKLK